MRRRRWFELHDQEWFPRFLRDLVTEALEAMWRTTSTYRPIAPLLRQAIRRSGADRVIDLCSGSGGPWPALYENVAQGEPLKVYLTDLYPNARAAAANGFNPLAELVDARSVPPGLHGFRTIFSSFHHFDPPSAHAILADAFTRREGIAVFEAARPSPGTLLALTGVPLVAWRNGAAIRPLQWSRLFWTCILPVVPAILWTDGILSCLRSYSLADLRELTLDLTAPDYTWQIGHQAGGLVSITYLIGTPQPHA